MKKALLVLGGLLLADSGRAQQLRGSYGTPPEIRGFESAFFHFEGQRFFYKLATDVGAAEGRGTFRISRKQLILHFEHSAADTTALIVRPGPPTDTATTFRFRVQIRKEDGGFMADPLVPVFNEKTYQGVATDSRGEAVLRYDMPTFDTLTVGYGRESVRLPVRAGVSQLFIVRRYEPVRYFAAGEIIKWRIKRQTPQTLELEQFLYTDEGGQPVYHKLQVNRLLTTDADAVRLPRP